jgi:hypothetical protein
MTPDDRERLLKLEIEFQHLRDELKDTREVLHKTNNKVQELMSLLDQGKGARWIFMGALALFGSGGVLGLLSLLSNLLRPHP